MKIATSILDCDDRLLGCLKLNETNTSYVHIDVMDGKFVSGIQFQDINEIKEISNNSIKPLDVHLMVYDPINYIDKLNDMNIDFITIHLEINKDKKEIFSKIRKLGYGVGLSIKPNTLINELEPFLNDIDMVLVMSVEPGMGGQNFNDSTVNRVNELKALINKYNKNILIEVDGGINNKTINKLDNVDIAVVGSYIVKSDNYADKIDDLLSLVK